MTEELRRRIIAAHGRLSLDCRSNPALESDVQAFENEFGPIPSEYRWYLLNCGGGVIGTEWIDDIRELPLSHRKFDSEPWSMRHIFVVGWDGAGNPYGIDPKTGKLWVEDHNVGGVHELAPSLIDFIARGLLGSGAV